MLPKSMIFPKNHPILGKKHAKNGYFRAEIEHFSSKNGIFIKEKFLYFVLSRLFNLLIAYKILSANHVDRDSLHNLKKSCIFAHE